MKEYLLSKNFLKFAGFAGLLIVSMPIHVVFKGSTEDIGSERFFKNSSSIRVLKSFLKGSFLIAGEVKCICRGQPAGSPLCTVRSSSDCKKCVTWSCDRCCAEFTERGSVMYKLCMNGCCPDRDGDGRGDWYTDPRGIGKCDGPQFIEPIGPILEELAIE